MLGPLFWNIIVNDVFECATNYSKIYVYADDINVVVTGENNQILKKRIQKVIEKIYNWATKCKLKFSTQKTVIMELSKGKPANIQIQLREKLIKSVENIKILGLVIDQS